MIGSKPYAVLKYREVNCSRMAYIDEGDGDAIIFQHGQPTSSYVWRNIMPHLEGMGRLVACDLIGMGGSDKLDPSLGPDRYRLANHRRYHSWGSARSRKSRAARSGRLGRSTWI